MNKARSQKVHVELDIDQSNYLPYRDNGFGVVVANRLHSLLHCTQTGVLSKSMRVLKLHGELYIASSKQVLTTLVCQLGTTLHLSNVSNVRRGNG